MGETPASELGTVSLNANWLTVCCQAIMIEGDGVKLVLVFILKHSGDAEKVFGWSPCKQFASHYLGRNVGYIEPDPPDDNRKGGSSIASLVLIFEFLGLSD